MLAGEEGGGDGPRAHPTPSDETGPHGVGAGEGDGRTAPAAHRGTPGRRGWAVAAVAVVVLALAASIGVSGSASQAPSAPLSATGGSAAADSAAGDSADLLWTPGPLAGPYTEPLTGPLAEPLSATVATTPAEDSWIRAYWTARRRAQAEVADRQDAASRSADAVPEARQAPTGGTSPPAASTGSPYLQGGPVTKTVGRLFSTIEGADFTCTATVVSSPSRDLVVTAGHCLHGGAGSSFATNVTFIPGYRDGAMPYGMWTARRITTTPAWGYDGNFDYDAGFALFNTNGGRHLQDVVGSHQIVFNQARTFAHYAFGYPRLPPYNGSQLVYCAGTPIPDPYGSPSFGLSCDMTAGASGGPLMTGLGRSGPGTGWVDSVISFAYVGEANILYGTYFGREIELLYHQTNEL